MPSSSTEQHLSAASKRRIVVLLTLAVLVLMLVAAELAIRARQHLRYGSSATVEDYYTVDPRIQLRVPIAGLTSGRVSINSLGFRGPEIEASKPAGTVRLAFLGASTTWCAEVSGNEHVWPHLVAEALRRAYPQTRFDYLNAAVPGYTMGAMLKSMEHRVAALAPDIVVIYEAANNLSGELRERAAEQGLVKTGYFEQFSWPSRYSLLWSLVEKNLRVLNAKRSVAADASRLTIDSRTLGEGYRAQLREVVRSAQRHAKLVAVATFSIHPRPEQSSEAQLRGSSSAFVYTPFVTPRLVIDSYARYNEVAREVARETGALLIEEENVIPGDPLHFADTVHFTDAGSRAMAERISRALLANAEVRKLISGSLADRGQGSEPRPTGGDAPWNTGPSRSAALKFATLSKRVADLTE